MLPGEAKVQAGMQNDGRARMQRGGSLYRHIEFEQWHDFMDSYLVSELKADTGRVVEQDPIVCGCTMENRAS